jgi:UDP-N-acetylmuramoyl-tripeptide--D-alanyl-D-alanine ligase
VLDRSLQRGTEFLLASQRREGDFRYHVNFVTGETAPEQGPVRQAGALWGLSLIHQDHPTAATREGVLRGIAFFEKHSRPNGRQQRFILFPGTREGDSGAVALVALSLIDFLRAEPVGAHRELRQQLDEYLRFLVSLRRPEDLFYRQYLHGSGEGWGRSSPYFDGEILLALTKAARYMGRADLRQQVLRSAEAMYQAYAHDALAEHRDDAATKGFFQWGSMAFLELANSGWEETEVYASRTVALAHWMIDVHRMLERRRNTAYAVEGVLCAYAMAVHLGDQPAASKFRDATRQTLAKLTAWQVGGPHVSQYLQSVERYDPSCRGGVLGADQNPWLRIDTTQHQMHAVILARRYLWK